MGRRKNKRLMKKLKEILSYSNAQVNVFEDQNGRSI